MLFFDFFQIWPKFKFAKSGGGFVTAVASFESIKSIDAYEAVDGDDGDGDSDGGERGVDF